MKKVPCEVYTRVVGYYRPVQNWNDGKQAEYFDRKEFSEEASLNSTAVKDEPEIFENGKSKEFWVGVEGCTDCDKMKKEIKAKEKEGKYFSFKKPRQALEFIKSLEVPLESEIVFPMAFQVS